MKNRIFNIVLLTAGTLSITGCSTFMEQLDEQMFVKRATTAGQAAWLDSRPAYVNIEHNLKHFGRGFIDGYVSVATGGDGCPPALPPRKYWRSRFSTPLGKQDVVAWFDGHQHGAAAAFVDGLGGPRKILTSGVIYNKRRERVEFEPEGEQQLSDEDYPEMIAPLPEPVKLPELKKATPAIKKIPSTPYVPEEDKTDKKQ